ncbi:HAD-IC family P-type ATPase, partial [bacterium]|nr:HAD-IC family P-type ATPase [bacterium]
IKAEASELVKYLKQQQIELMIMSGDFIPVVKSIAEKIGIAPEFAFGELSPEAKASEIRKLSYAGFIGDGVNDALAMKTAYLGIGLQGGIESNFEVADVYLLNGDLQNVVDLFAAAKRTLRLVKRNILLAACYNTLAAPLAACGYINPIFAAFVMPLASLTVISSTLLSKPFNCAVARGK